MKRTIGFTAAGASLISLWLWRSQAALDGRVSLLTVEIARARSAPLQEGPRGQIPGSGGSGKVSTAVEPGAAAPLKVEEFVDLVSEISRLETEMPPGADREPLRLKITDLFQRLSSTSPDQLREIMDRIPSVKFSSDGKEQVVSAIMGLLAKSDPSAAADYALKENAQTGMLESALRGWSKADPAAAIAWLNRAESGGRLPSRVNGETLRSILLPRLISADPGGAAVAEVARLRPEGLDGFLTDTARLLTTDAQRRAFMERLAATPGVSSEAAGKFLEHVSRETSPEVAMALLSGAESSLPAAQFNGIAAATITARIDSETPSRAEWLLRNLKGADREPAIDKLMRAWTNADFNAAACWLQKQPPSADHDVAIASFAPLVAEKEPPSAVDWAATIADPARRTAVLTSVYQNWSAKAADEAAAYFREKGLTVPGN